MRGFCGKKEYNWLMRFLKLLLSLDILIPVFGLVIYLSVFFVFRGTLPSGQELVADFGAIYAKFGYKIIFLAALLETLIFINFLVPGQLAMVLGIVFAKTGYINLQLVIVTIIAGALCGYLIDYLIGYFSFYNAFKKTEYVKYLKKAQIQITKLGVRALFLGFIHATVGSFTSVAAGTLNLNLFKFSLVALIATTFWTCLWGALIYSFGDLFISLLTKYLIFLLAAFIIFMISLKVINLKRV